MSEEKNTIEGRNPVFEALRSGMPIDKILISETAKKEALGKILSAAKDRKIPVQTVRPQKLAELAETEASQGVIAICAAAQYVAVDDILAKAEEKGKPPFVIIADEITDPHNLGAIIRTANAAGADGVIIPKNRSAGIGAIAAKTSAGAVSYTPVARVTNLAQTIDYLKERGLWVMGADMSGDDMYRSNLTGAIALVVGSEGKGISRLIKEKCDFMVRIPMFGEINSLNASVAAAVLMYEIVRQRET
ncbi:MAG: 23S rRNA (guanosine(2251)-2'-O)-methyltransferase RlmB, partial [Clostridia bacterium]|nr:23S rRNA (guanosine(2251)-2'-O)-methyltransferase RlmB [Clostridia bacterium]